MKVYYINSGLTTCYFVRCLLPMQENGWDGDNTSVRDSYIPPQDKTKGVLEAEVVVFHRPQEEGKLEMARLLKSQGKKIVYDDDDTAKHNGGFRFNDYFDAKRVALGMQGISATLDTFIKEADLVTCSTEWLAKEYRKINPNVVVLPNCIDPFYFDEPLRNETDVVRIGIVGSIATSDDLDVLEPILKHYNNDPRVRLVLFSLPPNKQDETMRKLYQKEYELWDSLNIEWQPYVPIGEYHSKLNELKLDMMIIPRKDNYFNRCKSNIKFLEASMLKIPVVASGFFDGQSPYEVDPDDAKHVVLVKDNDDWIHAIEILINNKEIREKMGEQAYNYVKEKYDIAKNAHKWEDAYKSIK